ncbi:MAG: electron transport complex subunit RsxE [Firmicutes bacterium HGW-Firmicutes-2]|jgi:electron transport complex protein RnfE|nr:MAG: electron transport complex subunit RsxE [Firmicutes bacterium HGW-Firmicutes-2]
MKSAIKRFKAGILDENPVFIQVLGMCPTLAVTTSAENGIGMGLATTTVLIMANLVISLLRNIIPSKVRIPAFIVVIASFVTIVDFMLQGFVPALYASLGLFIPLIVVNCVILGRAEGFASKNKPFISVVDGLGMGLGFTLALGSIGAVREILGAGTFFGMNVMPAGYVPISIMILAPGAFLVLGILLAAFNYVLAKAANRN